MLIEFYLLPSDLVFFSPFSFFHLRFSPSVYDIESSSFARFNSSFGECCASIIIHLNLQMK